MMKRFLCALVIAQIYILSGVTPVMAQSTLKPVATVPGDPYAQYTAAKQELVDAFTTKVSFTSGYTADQKSFYISNVVNSLKGIADTKLDDLKRANNTTRATTGFQTDTLNDLEKLLSSQQDSTPSTDTQKLQVLKDSLKLSSDMRGKISAGMFDQSYYFAASGGAGVVEDATQVQDTANAQVKKTQEKGATEPECSLVMSSTWTNCIDKGVTWLIKNTLLQIAGFALWLSANMFNYSIDIGILNFSQWAPDSLYPVWVIVRQIISLFVVFSGLFLAFMYMIEKGDDFKKYMPWVVIYGLFVNFSYPFTRALIDIANVISLNAYSAAMGSNILVVSAGNTPGALIVNKLGLQGLLAGATQASEAAVSSTNMLANLNSTPAALLAVIFVGYSAWVFFVATGVIIARTAMLAFIIIASPVLLVDSVVPKLGEKAMELRKIFFSQLVVAPVFMVMLSITIKFLDVFRLSAPGAGAAVSSGAVTYQTFTTLLLMIFSLKIMLAVTKNLSGKFGDFATSALGTVGGFAMGGTGLLARSSLGRGALALRKSERFGGWMDRNQHTFLGRQALKATESLSKSTFDVRNSKLVAGNASKLGLNLGMGAKLGFEQSKDAREKARAEHLERITGRIQTRFANDVYDKNGKLLHRKGDIDERGLTALSRLRQAENNTANKAVRKITGTDRQDQVFEKLNTKMTEEDKQLLEKETSEMMKNYSTNPETGKKTSREERVKFLGNLEDALQKAKELDPGHANTHTQALVSTIAKIKNQEQQEKEEFDRKVKNAIDVYNTLSDEKRATFIARQDEEVQKELRRAYQNSDSFVGPHQTEDISQEETPVPVPPRPQSLNDTYRNGDMDTFNKIAAVPAYARRSANPVPITQTPQTPIEQAYAQRDMSAVERIAETPAYMRNNVQIDQPVAQPSQQSSLIDAYRSGDTQRFEAESAKPAYLRKQEAAAVQALAQQQEAQTPLGAQPNTPQRMETKVQPPQNYSVNTAPKPIINQTNFGSLNFSQLAGKRTIIQVPGTPTPPVPTNEAPANDASISSQSTGTSSK